MLLFKVFLIAILSFANTLSAKDLNFGLLLEGQNLDVKNPDDIEFNLDNFNHQLISKQADNYDFYQIIDRDRQLNREFFEFIGMFVSDYKSQQDIKLKFKFKSDITIREAYFIYKIYF